MTSELLENVSMAQLSPLLLYRMSPTTEADGTLISLQVVINLPTHPLLDKLPGPLP